MTREIPTGSLNVTNFDQGQRNAGQIVVGSILVAAGILIVGAQMELWVWDFRRVWPVVLIALGLRHVLSRRHTCGPASGFVLMGIGGVLLLHTAGVLGLRQSWPLFIVISGLSIMVSGFIRGGTPCGLGSDRHGD